MQEQIAELKKQAFLKELFLEAQGEFSLEEMTDFEQFLRAKVTDGTVFPEEEEEERSGRGRLRGLSDAGIGKTVVLRGRSVGGRSGGDSAASRPKSILMAREAKAKQRSKTVTFDAKFVAASPQQKEKR